MVQTNQHHFSNYVFLLLTWGHTETKMCFLRPQDERSHTIRVPETFSHTFLQCFPITVELVYKYPGVEIQES